MNDLTRIAGHKTVGDWKEIRHELDQDFRGIEIWGKAYSFLEERLNSRYFKPIEDIKQNDDRNGEGFAIVTILCSLIEFLETTWSGEVYRYCKDHELNQFEYNRSKKKFISFLTSKPPFKNIFSEDLATKFYVNVRCGLLHEAATKSNWIIRVDNESIMYELRSGENVIDRNLFEGSIKEFITFYRSELFKSDMLKLAFIRKMNSISGLPINY